MMSHTAILNVPVTAADPDGDTMTYSLVIFPSFVTIFGHAVIINPAASGVGTHTVTVQATANGLSDTESFEVTIRSVFCMMYHTL